jgi:hypothetical protein
MAVPFSGSFFFGFSLTRRSGDVTGNAAIPCHVMSFDA